MPGVLGTVRAPVPPSTLPISVGRGKGGPYYVIPY